MVTGLNNRGIRVRFRAEATFLLPQQFPDRLHDLPSLVLKDTGLLSSGLKLSRRKTNYSLPPSADLADALSHTSIPPYLFISWCLIKLAKKKIFP
jgi:hypothetical protein